MPLAIRLFKFDINGLNSQVYPPPTVLRHARNLLKKMTWLFTVSLLSCVGLGAAFSYLRIRRQKKDHLELRLLAGRRRLLEEEIAHNLETLQNFTYQALSTQQQEGREALDQLHLLLVERQAHLLNSEDLIHLQNYKISVLKAILDDDASDRPAPSNSEIAPGPTALAEEPPSHHRDRANVENQLLSKIGQLNKGTSAEKKPRQK